MAQLQDQLQGSLQENALTLLCFSEKYHRLVRDVVAPELFSTFLYRDLVTRVHAYIDQWRKPPGRHLPDLVEDVLADDGDRSQSLRQLLRSVKELSENLNEEYAVSKLRGFVRQQRLKIGIVEAVEAIERGDLDRAEKTVRDSLKLQNSAFDPGMNLKEAFESIGKRRDDTNDLILTGVSELDARQLVPARKQLFAFGAPFGRGKTWWWLHCARQALIQKWRVLYVSLEMDPEQIGRRMLQMLFSMTRHRVEVHRTRLDIDRDGTLVGLASENFEEWESFDNPKDLHTLKRKLSAFRSGKNFLVKQFPTSSLTHEHLVAYLDALEAQSQFVPDLLIVDYPKLMALDPRNLRLELGAVYERLRGLAVERNMAVGVALQLNREGTQARSSAEMHIAEDVSIMGTADIVVLYSQTEAEHRLQLARLFAAKSRDEVSRFTVLVSQSYATGQFVVGSQMLSSEYWMLLNEQQKEKKNGNGEAAAEAS